MVSADTPYRRYRRPAGALLSLTLCATAAACSSRSNDQPPSASSSGSASCTTESTKLVHDSLSAVTASPYPTAVNASAVKGKTYWLILLNGGLPTQAQMADSFKAAVAAAGAKSQVFDGKAAPATMIQGIDSAIAAKADGIVTEAIDASLIQPALTRAKAAGIPVIDAFGGEPAPPYPDGIVGRVGHSALALGKLQGDYVLKQTNCAANALVVTTLSAASSANATKGAKDEITRLCGSACTTTTIDVSPADIATKTTGLVQTALQRDPKINVIINSSDSYVAYTTQALKALGRDVPIVGATGAQVSVGQKGGSLVADVAYTPFDVVGWYFFHGVIQAQTGATGVALPLPLVMLDKSNWGSDASPMALQPAYQGYQDKFKQLWGVASS